MVLPNHVALKIQNAYHFSDFEIAKMNYTLTVFAYEISKLILLTAFFLSIGYIKEFFISICILLPLRSISGGLHMGHYFSCLICTFLFFCIPILFLNRIILPYSVQLLTLFAATFSVFLIGPVPSKKRPLLTQKRYRITRLLSGGLMLFNSSILIYFPSFSCRNLWYWILILQAVQLMIARILRKGAVYIKSEPIC